MAANNQSKREKNKHILNKINCAKFLFLQKNSSSSSCKVFVIFLFLKDKLIALNEYFSHLSPIIKELLALNLTEQQQQQKKNSKIEEISQIEE